MRFRSRIGRWAILAIGTAALIATPASAACPSFAPHLSADVFTRAGETTGCATGNGTSCQWGETIVLTARAQNTYVWQECDRFTWTLMISHDTTEIGTTSTPELRWQSPLRYDAAGDVQIRVTVTNALGSDERASFVPMRTQTCVSTPIPNAFITLRGTESACTELSASCIQTEPIAFSLNFLAGRTTPCARFVWSWGDGTTSMDRDLTSVTHSYGPVGTFTPSVSITDGQYTQTVLLHSISITARILSTPPPQRHRSSRH